MNTGAASNRYHGWHRQSGNLLLLNVSLADYAMLAFASFRSVADRQVFKYR
jgi:hypothetical protein